MRRIALLLISFALVLGSVWAVQAQASYSPVGPGDVYLALGDSLATGTEAAANNDNLGGYPDLVYEQLKTLAPNLAYTNLADGTGETSSRMLLSGDQLDQAIAFIESERAAGRTVSPVTLSIGGNDLVAVFRGGSSTVTDTITLFESNFATIIDRLNAALTVNGRKTGDLVVMNYYNPYPGLQIGPPLVQLPPGQETIITERDVQRFNAALTAVATTRGVPVVDAYTPVVGRETTLLFVRIPYQFFDSANFERNFDYHPRLAGHQVIADGFVAALDYDNLPPPMQEVYLPLVPIP